jgi:hypothetical protein
MTPVKPPEDDAGARVVWLRRGERSYHDKRNGYGSRRSGQIEISLAPALESASGAIAKQFRNFRKRELL